MGGNLDLVAGVAAEQVAVLVAEVSDDLVAPLEMCLRVPDLYSIVVQLGALAPCR